MRYRSHAENKNKGPTPIKQSENLKVNGESSGGMLMSDAIPESEPMEIKKGDDSDDSLDRDFLPLRDDLIKEEGDILESDGSASAALSSKPETYSKRSKSQIEAKSKRIKEGSTSRRSQTVFNYRDFPASNSIILEQDNVMSSTGAQEYNNQ